MKLETPAVDRLAAAVRIARHPSDWSRLSAAVRDRAFPALAYKGYSRLWQANLGGMTGYWMQTVVQGWLVIELTNSPFMLGLLAFFRSIPMLLLSPFGGVLADRFDRPRLLLIAQSLLAVTALAVGALVAAGWIQIWHLIVSSLVFGTTFAINVPARYALLSDLIPRKHLGNAVGLNSATMSGARIIGPSIAGYLIGVIGIAGTYFAQVGAYAWGIFNVARIKSDTTQSQVTGSTMTILRDGFAYVYRTKTILSLMMLTLSPALFGMPITMLLPAFVSQDLRGGPKDLGILMGALGVGSLIGALGVVARSQLRRKGRAVLISLIVYGFLLVALAFMRTVFLAALVLAVSGFFQAIYMALNQTIIQLLVPSEIRGRVMSIWMLNWGLMPLGLLPMSAVAERQGTPVAMVIGGVLSILVVAVVFARNRELWSLEPDFEDAAG